MCAPPRVASILPCAMLSPEPAPFSTSPSIATEQGNPCPRPPCACVLMCVFSRPYRRRPPARRNQNSAPPPPPEMSSEPGALVVSACVSPMSIRSPVVAYLVSKFSFSQARGTVLSPRSLHPSTDYRIPPFPVRSSSTDYRIPTNTPPPTTPHNTKFPNHTVGVPRAGSFYRLQSVSHVSTGGLYSYYSLYRE